MQKTLLKLFLASVLLTSFPILNLQAQEDDHDMLMEQMPIKSPDPDRSNSEETKNDMMGQGMMGRRMMGKGMTEGCSMMDSPMGMGMMGHGIKRNYKALTEGRLAYIKAELDITEAQKTAWEEYANTIRARSTTLQEMRPKLKKGMQSGTPVERIDTRIKSLEARLEALKAVKVPLENLYSAFNDAQKKKADTLLSKDHCMM